MPGQHPSGGWIQQRAHHILSKNPDLSGEKGKSIAYAVATQQAHRLGKSPKDYRTRAGVRRARQKFDRPKKEYVQTADPKTSAADLRKVAAALVEAWLLKMATTAEGFDPAPAIAGTLAGPGGAFVTGKGVKSIVSGRDQDRIAAFKEYMGYEPHEELLPEEVDMALGRSKLPFDSRLQYQFLGRDALRKKAAGPPPSIPTPQFPGSLPKIQPNKLPTTTTGAGGVLKQSPVSTYTQVHTQPPSVNTSPYQGVKAAPPPPAR